MGKKRAASLGVAFILGSALAVGVGSWREPGAAGQASGQQNQPAKAQSPASGQPELLAEQPESDQRGATPASYEEPESTPAATDVPALPPGDRSPAEERPAADRPATDADPARADAPAPADGSLLVWHDDYGQAMDAAIEQQRMMLIFFFDPARPESLLAFEQESLANPKNREIMAREFVSAKLPTDTVITRGGKPLELLKHPAFAEMLGRPGVAVLDFAHPGTEYSGHVVSTFPFVSGKYYSRPVLLIVLNLPPGTLTQRTMIYAVRIHPEAPASTQGQFHGVLADEANRHSSHQAAILVQGHHNWESRVQRISTRLQTVGGAEEVVAESWPSENLVEACVDCVDSWRHSPGHWQAVRTRHPLFGFDIQRGRNGIWYATGIFGHR